MTLHREDGNVYRLEIQGTLREIELRRCQQELAAEILERLRGAAPVPPPADPSALRGLKFADCLGDDLAALVLRERLADPAAVAESLATPPKVLVRPS